jgi:phosphatidylinositol glycan class M
MLTFISQLISLSAQVGLIFYGNWQDSNYRVKYTDIDYWILRDAAKLILIGKSPYERATFRYSPLFALPPLLDEITKSTWMTKTIFSIANTVVGYLLVRMLTQKHLLEKEKANLITLACWSLNPLVIGISSRGNAESFVVLLIALFTYFVSLQRRFLAALCLGIAIHLKLFPIVYLPTALVFYGLFPWASSKRKINIDCGLSTASQSKQPSLLYNKFINLKRRHVSFLLTSVLSSAALFWGAYYLYGEIAIKESLTYHLTRSDHRHNFSPFFALFHSRKEQISPIYRSVLFAPQLILLSGIALKFGRIDFPFACFLQTFTFVSFNRVITSQVS